MSNQLICSEVNGELKVDNNGTEYCTDNGNVTLINPAGAISNNVVNQSDLITYASLRANVKTKSLVTNRVDENILAVNFLKAKESNPGTAPEGTSFLTTNWTKVGSLSSQLGDDLETFGMTNIDININSGFVPTITIDFEDIRGATLFEQGSCSPYAAFFHQPYPVFELTIKGYYGDPIRYQLQCMSFITSFDAASGNYKSKGEFVGYTFGFLSDILLGYIMASPYLERAPEVLTNIYEEYLDFYKEEGYNGANGRGDFNPLIANDGRPLTIYNYVRKLQELQGQGNSDEGAIAEIQNSTELESLEDLNKLSEIISDIEEFIVDFKGEWESKGGESDGDRYTYGVSGGGSTGGDNIVLDVYEKYFGLVSGIIPIRTTIFNERIVGASVTEITNKVGVQNDAGEIQLSLSNFKSELNQKNKEISTALNIDKENFKKLANEKIKAAIGFVPTIRSFFTVLLANTELFLELLKQVSTEAESYHEKTPDTFLYKGVSKKVSDVVYAWPTYVEQKKNSSGGGFQEVETYPGNNPKFSNWPEVRFVEEFLNALTEMQKDIEGEEEEEVNPEIDPYDGIPGRDNYYPINAVETPVGAFDAANSYYNMNSIDSFYKILAERFMILSNVSSPNSNHLNTSIIATARNNFYIELKNRGKDAIFPVAGKEDTFSIVPLLEELVPSTERGEQFTPYYSVGDYVFPTKFGGDGSGYGFVKGNGTLNDKTEYLKKYSNILGQPFVNVSTSTIGGTDSGNNSIRNSIDSDGENISIANLNSNNLTSSEEDRTFLINVRGEKQNKGLMDTVTDTPNNLLYLLVEPKFKTETIMYIWPEDESILSRNSQLDQIPTAIKENTFIVMGSSSIVQNTSNLSEAIKNFYDKSGNTRTNQTGNIIGFDFNNYAQILIGYGKGAINVLNTSTNNGFNKYKFIGLTDPNLNDVYGVGVDKWYSNDSRMLWGSVKSDGTYPTKNYETLEAKIKVLNGKSEKIPNLTSNEALKIFFEKYGEEIIPPPAALTPQIIQYKTPTPKPPTPQQGQNNDTSSTGLNISKRQAENWEFLGRVEAHNTFNSIENNNLLGNIVNSTDNFKELYKNIIKSLNLGEEDVFTDKYNSVYRYNKPLTLNKVSKKDGGIVKITPDIHSMAASNLVRLKKFDAARENGFEFKNTPISVWMENKSGRKGFGLEEDSTWIKSNVLKDYYSEHYGNYPSYNRGNGQPDNKIGTSRNILLDTKDTNWLSEKTNYNTRKGLINSTLFMYDLPWYDSTLKVNEKGLKMFNRFTQDSLTVADKLTTVDIFPDYEIYYAGFKNVTNIGDKIPGGDFNYRYGLTYFEFNNDTVKTRQYTFNGTWKAPFASWWINDPTRFKDVEEYSSLKFKTTNPEYVSLDRVHEYSTGYGIERFDNDDYKGIIERNKKDIVIPAVLPPTISKPVYQRVAGTASVVQIPKIPPALVKLQQTTTIAAQADPNSPISTGFAIQHSVTPQTDPYRKANDGINNNQFNFGGSIVETPFWKHNLPATEVGSNVKKSYYSFYGNGFFNVQTGKSEERSVKASKQRLHMGLKNDLDSWAETSKYFPSGNGNFNNLNPNNLDIPLSDPNWNYYYSEEMGSTGNQPTALKYMLTTHNQDTFNVKVDSDFNITNNSNSTLTNYNRTKDWKGSLAYLFLANQYHKPWTGLYTSTSKNLGPQGFLGIASTNLNLPKHSVLMLGAVLWRLRESGLLKSDDSKWNMEPSSATIEGEGTEVIVGQLQNPATKYGGAVDPLNFPLLPKEIEAPGQGITNLWQFVKYENSSLAPAPINGKFADTCGYPANRGLRPPMASYTTTLNRFRGVNRAGNNNIVTAPAADEWPVLNTGLIYAYDFFNDMNVENPFKNQYKIWTPFLGASNSNLLRYVNSDVRWTTSSKQVGDFTVELKKQLADDFDLEQAGYSDSARENIAKTLQGEVLKQYNEETERFKKLAKESGGSLNFQSKEAKTKAENNGLSVDATLGATDAGYARLPYLHTPIDTLFKLSSPVLSITAAGVQSLNFSPNTLEAFKATNYHQEEDARSTLWKTSFNTQISTTASNRYTGAPAASATKDNKLDKTVGIIVEVKTYSELKKLIENKKVNLNGEEIDIKQIIQEETYPKELVNITIEIGPGSTTYLTDLLQGSFVSTTRPPGLSNGQQTYTNTYSLELNNIDFIYDNASYILKPQIEDKSGFFETNYITKTSSDCLQGECGLRSLGSLKSKQGYPNYNDEETLYRPVAPYTTIDNGTFDYYVDETNVKWKVGRRFRVLKQTEVSENTPTDGISDSEINKLYETQTQFTGYQRGYLPLGPDIWFMPTVVKNLFIKEFEDFVGDSNNFGNSSFDTILAAIDPLNFPTIKGSTNAYQGVFENEITYSTFIEEIGDLYSDAPTVQKLDEDDRLTLGSEVDIYVDGDGLPLLPTQLQNYLDFYTIRTGYKPISVSADAFKSTKIQKQNTNQDNKLAKDIYNELFTSYYLLTSTTPRTFWGEFPLKNEDGELKETVNDYFKIGQQELTSFTKGFVEEINSSVIKNAFVDKIKEDYSGEIDSTVLGATQDDDLKLTLYRSLKSIYDKWISSSKRGTFGSTGDKEKLFYNPIGPDRLLIDHFSFVNRVNADIADRALVDLDTVTNLFNNTKNSIFGVTSDILDKSNFAFYPLPAYVDLSSGLTKFAKDKINADDSSSYRAKVAARMFQPLSDISTFQEAILNSAGPHFMCMYIGGNSQTLDLGHNTEEGCLSAHGPDGKIEKKGDNIKLSDPNRTPIDFKGSGDVNDDSQGVVAFQVQFGSENQSHFKGLSVGQTEHKNTQESLVAIDKISNSGTDGGSGGFIAKGQSLYEVYLNRSYTCTVEGLGNMMIQPLQYFQLENVPMFYGAYLIREVKHNVRPHHVNTTFVGDRIPYAVVPVIEDFISTFKLKPQQKGQERKSLKGSSGSSGGSGGSGGSGRAGSPVPVSSLPASNNTEVIKNKLQAQDFSLVPYLTTAAQVADYGGTAGRFLNTFYAKNEGGGSGSAWGKGTRRENGPDGITLHWSAGDTYEGAFSTLISRGKKGQYALSYHIEIGQDGVAYQFSSLDRTAAHAGCPSSKINGCNDQNPSTVGISYAGGVEGGYGTTYKGNCTRVGYQRTWEEWQTEELTVPFCKFGQKKGEFGYFVCCSEGDTKCSYGCFKGSSESEYKSSAKGKSFKSKKQWESLVNSILYAKVKWPNIRYVTSHHWSDGDKIDVGPNFPWDKLFQALKDGGWNKENAGADPVFISEWPNELASFEKLKNGKGTGKFTPKKGEIIRPLRIENTDYIMTTAEFQEFTGNNGGANPSNIEGDQKALSCKILNGSWEVGGSLFGKGLMADLDLTREQASGIIGNLIGESGLIADRIEDSSDDKPGRGLITQAVKTKSNGEKSNRGYGWAQWTGTALKEAFIKSSKDVGVDLNKTPANDDVSYKFLLEFLKSSGSGGYAGAGKPMVDGKQIDCGKYPKIKETKTVAEASDFFLKCYEKPGSQNPNAKGYSVEKQMASINKRRGLSAGVFSSCGT